MQSSAIRQIRLANQLITGSVRQRPEEIVKYMGAMQAQEYTMAKWAVGLRGKEIFEPEVEKAFQEGRILRTHLLRPTWHFTAPEDIRWITELTAPHVQRLNSSMYRKSELDERTLNAACELIYAALAGGKALTRDILAEKLAKGGIPSKGHRLAYIMMYAELTQVAVSGPRQGKQFTYALLDEVVPSKSSFSREEMLAMLAERYFTSRGPATVLDFAYWSGLPAKDARIGAESLSGKFVREQEHIYIPPKKEPDMEGETFLMPDYDEYGMSYKDRSALLFYAEEAAKASIYSHWLVVGGGISGTWDKNQSFQVQTTTFASLEDKENTEVEKAKRRYQEFWKGI